jgi:hypothetical protein
MFLQQMLETGTYVVRESIMSAVVQNLFTGDGFVILKCLR